MVLIQDHHLQEVLGLTLDHQEAQEALEVQEALLAEVEDASNY